MAYNKYPPTPIKPYDGVQGNKIMKSDMTTEYLVRKLSSAHGRKVICEDGQAEAQTAGGLNTSLTVTLSTAEI